MTYRAKAGLQARIAAIVPDNDTEEVSPADLRELLLDLVDSYEQGTQPLAAMWARGFEDAGQQMTDAELELAITPDWVRQGTRVEGTVYITPGATAGIAFAVFYFPTAWWPAMQAAGLPKPRQGIGGIFPVVLGDGLVGNVGYTLVRSLRRSAGSQLGSEYQVGLP